MKKLLLILFLVIGSLTARAQSNIVVFSNNPDNTYEEGEVATFTYMVTNNGPDPALNVLVFYPLPPNLPMPAGIQKFWWSGSNGSSGTNMNLSNTIPSLGVNQTVTYTINIRIPNGYDEELPDLRVTYASQSDLVVVNTNNQDNYVPGQQSVYTVTVTNNGPEDAMRVRVQNAIPTGITQFSWTGSNGSSGNNAALDNMLDLLPVGETVTYTITLQVPASYTGNLTSQTNLTVSVTDPVPGCTQCTDTDAPNSANLVVQNTNNQSNYLPGHPSVYAVTVTNTGPYVAHNVSVSEAIPAGITNFSWTGSNGTSGTNVNLQDVIATLAANETVTYTVTLQVPANYNAANLVSTVAVSSPSDADFTCTDCVDTDAAPSGPNVIVTVEDGQEFYTPGPGNSIIYTLTVTNDGPGDAENVQLDFGFSGTATGAGFSWTSSEGGSGSQTGTGQLPVETIPVIADGQTITYTITAGPWPDAFDDPITAGVSMNIGTVPATAHCVHCSDTDLPEYADITVTNTDNQQYYLQGDTLVYTVTVANAGPAAAENVHVSNAIPAGITGFSWTGSNGSAGTDSAIDDTILSLAAGDVVTYTVTLQVPDAFSGDLTNETVVTSDTPDPTPACAACADTNQEATSADIVTTKTLESGTVYTAGTDAVYTITITNQGPSPALNVAVEDIVSAGLDASAATWSGNNTSGTGNLTDTIPLLGVNETVTYTFTVPVPSNFSQTANITNTVSVTSPTPDPNPGCAACTVVATPSPKANIITYKTNGQDQYVANEQTTYTITITNPGPSDAHNVHVHDSKPVNIDLMTWSGNNAGASGALDNTIAVLPAGESITYTVNIFIPANYPDSTYELKNVVVVTSDTPDPVPACLGCQDTDTPAPKFVTVTQDQYSIQELVLDVLIDVPCLDVSNITASAGPNNMGIGYFKKNNSTFPVKSGVVMQSGNAAQAGGPNSQNPMSTGNWGGDAQLLTYIQNTGIDPFVTSYNDVTKIEFDFVPLSSNMSFDFVFASEEYGDYQCQYSDAFAFFLTNTSTNTTTNLALIPSTTTPIAVTTVRNATYNSGCSSQNAAYFGAWYGENPTLPIAQTAPIAFDGRTTVLTAQSAVNPGTTYHIKLVIGDRNDNAWDSAVFLSAGSFDIGQPTLPTDLTIGAVTALCPGETYDLQASITPGTQFTLTWEKDGELITDANGNPVTTSTITVSEPGVYSVLASSPSTAADCDLRDDIRIEYQPEIEVTQPEDLSQCGAPATTATFDLTEVYDNMMSTVTNPILYEVYYYHNMAEIDNDDPSIIFPENYTGTDGETIYVTVKGYNNDCKTIRTFQLRILDCNVPLNQPPTMHVCEDAPYDGVAQFDLTAGNDDMLSDLTDPSNYTVTYHHNQGDAESGENDIVSPATYQGTTETIYVRVENNQDATIYGTTQFNLIVTPQPAFADLDDVEICDSYTLPVFTEGDYYTQPNGAGAMLVDGTAITTSQTVYRYSRQGTAPYTCTYENSFVVTINPTPVVSTPDDVQACTSYTLPDIAVGEYRDENGNVLPIGTVLTETQDVTVYAETGTNVICSDSHTFTVTINNAPVLQPATPLEVCNDDFDSSAVFNLTQAGAEVVGNQNNLTLTYHQTLDEAQAGTGGIGVPDAYNGMPGTVYIRAVETGTTTNCYSIAEVELIIQPRPAVPNVSNYVLCDDNNSPDGVEIFNLLSKNSEATSDPQNEVTYYTNFNDADGGTNAISNPGTYESPNAAIWVRVETEFGCYSVSSFELVVNPLPVVNTDMDPAKACEETPGQGIFDLLEIDDDVTFSASGLGVEYYASLDDAENDGPQLPQQYPSPSTTIYAKVTNTVTGCSVITPVELEVLPAPIAPDLTPLEECDPNNDNVTLFNINEALQEIYDAMGNSVILSVHETMADAQFGTNDVTNLANYTNVFALTTNGIQTLYIRVENASECFDIAPLQLIVHPVPEATEPEPYALCDNGNNDTDGIATFDLTTLEDEIMGNIDPVAFRIAFYTDEAAAIEGISPIPNPASFNSPSAIIYARVTNNATGCYDIVEVELIVNPLPVANNPIPYTLCDINAPGDEQEVFDLTTKIDEIITTPAGVQQGIIATFYHSYDDAVAGINMIDNPEAYTNTSAVETIFVKVALEETGCYRIVLLDVRVEPVPVLVPPTDDELTVCDTTGLGYGVFDLEALVEDMVNGAPSLQVTFHITYQDAIDGVNPITGDLAHYHNVDALTQFLYVRVVNTVTGCTRLEPYTLILTVEPAPMAPEDLEDLVQCDDTDNNNQNGQAIFDLTVQDAVIHAALNTDPSTLIIHYFTSEENAQNGVPRITNPSSYNGTDGQTIWVRVETPDTECFSVTSFQLILNRPLALTTPTILALCNESLEGTGNDGITEFDLTVKDEEILGPMGIGQGMTVTYFEIDPRVDSSATPIATPDAYTNPGPPQSNPKTLYVMVTTAEGCKSYTTLTIKVLPLPVPDTNAAPLVQCDVNSSPDGMEIFDLTDAAADIRNNDATMVLTYYETEQDAHDRINQIPDPTNYNSGSATIWVRAEASTGNSADPVCYQVVSFEIIVNPLPALGEAGVIDPYAICEQNTDGIATFDFNTHLDEILGENANTEDYTVRFYRDAAALAANTAMPYIYTNTSSPNQQNIIVWVRHDETGCTTTAPLTLLVEEAATANPITETFFECDYDGTNDGVFTFDLTRADDDALGTQDPATYSVTYYTSLEDAEEGINEITNPTAFQNTPDYQMIWVRVTNESTVSGCHEITTLELFVERIPEPELTTDHTTVCINFDTNQPERFATIDSGLDATHTFVWSHDGVVMAGETGPTITVGEPGAYTVVATSPTGCVSDPIASLVIEKSGPASPIGVGYVTGNPFGDNQVITVLVQGYGEYQYSLDNGPWQNSNVFENVSAYPVDENRPGHTIHVRDIATADPCSDLNLDLALDGVSVIDYPKFFTPNGDGIHDTWKPFGLGDDAIVYIFDRYGKLLKQISTAADATGWDGTYNGAQLPADDYWFTIEYTINGEKREFKAHFAMKR